MGDTFKRVQAGQKLAVSARAYNAMLETTEAYQRSRLNGGAGVAAEGQAQLVLVKNSSGSDTLQFDVLGVSGVLFSPADSDALKQFKKAVTLTGEMPSTASHECGRFVICAESIPNGSIGKAYAHGVCQVKINVISEADNFADVKDGDHTLLDSSGSGAVSILWKESGTGTKWAVVRFGASGGTIRCAICKEDAPSGNVIRCNLRSASTGLEITTGINGTDYNIEVHCNISGGDNLNSCIRSLSSGDELNVCQLVYDNSGTPTKYWVAIEGFQTRINCACTPT
jgi:hypothetical protein